MAVKDIIGRGVGFSPGTIKFVITHGFAIGIVTIVATAAERTLKAINELRTLPVSAEDQAVETVNEQRILIG